jgi:hypothetical protein
MYHVPVNRPPHDSRRRLPLIGALQGALFGFIRAMAVGAILGGVGVTISIATYALDSHTSGTGLTVIGGFLFWMLGVMVLGGVPAAIIGSLTGLSIGIKLMRLQSCDDAVAGRIGRRTSMEGSAMMALVSWLIGLNHGNPLGVLIAVMLAFSLPCMIYIVTAERFATLLNQRYSA